MIKTENKSFSLLFLWIQSGLFELSIFKIEDEHTLWPWSVFNLCYCEGDVFLELLGNEFTLREAQK